jgi:hypothetical protein
MMQTQQNAPSDLEPWGVGGHDCDSDDRDPCVHGPGCDCGCGGGRDCDSDYRCGSDCGADNDRDFDCGFECDSVVGGPDCGCDFVIDCCFLFGYYEHDPDCFR